MVTPEVPPPTADEGGTPGPGGGASRRAWTACAAVVAGVSFLPFLRGALLGHAFFFRDLAISFFPTRLFLLDGLRHGVLRDWNPFVHEGEPMILPPPVSYPLELLQLLRPDEVGLSLFLALHVPFAAVAFLVLARVIGLRPVAAAGGAFAYALGGFVLSTLNLYFHLLAAAWAPLVLAALLVAAERGGRWIPVAVGVVAVSLSTLGLETVIQTMILGLLLAAWPADRVRWGRLAQVLLLAAALCAPLVAAGLEPPEGSARRLGFTTGVVLAHSVHPLTLFQVVVGGFLGDLGDLTNRWWGQNFFPRGFPNILSLYLGAVVLAAAWTGVRHGGAFRRRLAVAALVAVVLSLGRWVGLSALVDLLPVRPSRYPVKAFFSVELCVALLAASGLDALIRRPREAGNTFLVAALALGGALVAFPLVPVVAPGFTDWFLNGFLPPSYSGARALDAAHHIVTDAATGGALCLLAGAAVYALRRRPGREAMAALAVVALVAVDLLRTGAGLNPMVSPAFFRLSPEMSREARELRGDGRVFTCHYAGTAAYGSALVARMRDGLPHDTWTFAVAKETLNADLGIAEGVSKAYGLDLKMLTPSWRVVTPRQAACRDVPAILPRLRSAGVTHVLSLDPLDAEGLRLEKVVRPARIAPLGVRVYAVEDSEPLVSVVAGASGGAATEARGEVVGRERSTDRIELEVRARSDAVVMVRESHAAGWTARVNGSPAEIEATPERYMAVPVPAGDSRVVLDFSPPGRALALAVTALAAALTLWLALRRRGPGGGVPAEPG